MGAMRVSSPHGSRMLAAVSALLLSLVVGVAVIVGVCALRNPNHIEFGAPWPVVSELVAAGVAASLALGVRKQRRRMHLWLFYVRRRSCPRRVADARGNRIRAELQPTLTALPLIYLLCKESAGRLLGPSEGCQP
jgi:hypothetical protein